MIEVSKQLGSGFLEKVYQEALMIEFQLRNIPFEREKRLPVCYKGHVLAQEYIADFVCYGHIIVELKAVDTIIGIHQAQVINYLKATGFKLGLLANFGKYPLKVYRLAN